MFTFTIPAVYCIVLGLIYFKSIIEPKRSRMNSEVVVFFGASSIRYIVNHIPGGVSILPLYSHLALENAFAKMQHFRCNALNQRVFLLQLCN